MYLHENVKMTEFQKLQLRYTLKCTKTRAEVMLHTAQGNKTLLSFKNKNVPFVYNCLVFSIEGTPIEEPGGYLNIKV